MIHSAGMKRPLGRHLDALILDVDQNDTTGSLAVRIVYTLRKVAHIPRSKQRPVWAESERQDLPLVVLKFGLNLHRPARH